MNQDDFRLAMAEAGIHYSGELVADGQRHRFRPDEDKRANAVYQLWDDEHPAGWAKDYKHDVFTVWSSKNGVEQTDAERRAWRERRGQLEAERAQAEAEFRSEVRARAREKWEPAHPETGEHAYLRSKRVGSHGLRTNGHLIYVPVRDSEGNLHGLQYIDPTGAKRFLTGTAVRAHYHLIEEINTRLLICEGYATGASLHEVTEGEAVAVAFDAGNLKPVAEALKGQYSIIVCADDDRKTEGNPGLTKAREAARAVGGKLAMPLLPHTSPSRVPVLTLNKAIRCRWAGSSRNRRSCSSHDNGCHVNPLSSRHSRAAKLRTRRTTASARLTWPTSRPPAFGPQ